MKMITAILATILLSGCAAYVTGRYSISADNVMTMRSWNGVKLNIGNFSDATNTSKMSCNYKGDINTMDGESYVQFIRNALVSELKFSGVYSATAPVTITGRLDQIDNSTAFSTDWTLVMTLSSSNGKSVTITENYHYNGSVFGTAASTCGSLAAAFVPAVQDLIGKIIQEVPSTLL